MTTLIVAKNKDESEIFYTVQGEGPRTGVPTIFLRVSGCNLNCKWCDTQYTWNWDVFDQDSEQLKMPIEEVVEKILKTDCKSLVITGGEPTLQSNALCEMIDLLRTKGTYFIEMETNGSKVPSDELYSRVDEFNVSPKLEHSGNTKANRDNPEAIAKHLEGGKSVFKFVIATPTDVAEVQELQARHNIPNEKIYLMPEGIKPEQVIEKMKWLVELCKESGYNLCTRLHVIIWGAKRGI